MFGEVMALLSSGLLLLLLWGKPAASHSSSHWEVAGAAG